MNNLPEVIDAISDVMDYTIRESDHTLKSTNVDIKAIVKLAVFFSAIESGQYHVVESLLATYCSVDNVNIGLLVATCHGHSDLIKLMLDVGADVNVKSTNLADCPYVRGQGWDTQLRTPLIFSVLKEQPNITRLLLEMGADIHADNDAAIFTAIGHYSYRDLNRECVRILITYGANVNAIRNNQRPIDVALSHGDNVILKLLLNQPDIDANIPEVMVHYFYARYQMITDDVFALLIEHNLDKVDRLLEIALSRSNTEIVKTLILHGAHINNDHYQLCASRGKCSHLKLLLQYATEQPWITNRNILASAISDTYSSVTSDQNITDRLNIIDLLVDNGADINFIQIEDICLFLKDICLFLSRSGNYKHYVALVHTLRKNNWAEENYVERLLATCSRITSVYHRVTIFDFLLRFEDGVKHINYDTLQYIVSTKNDNKTLISLLVEHDRHIFDQYHLDVENLITE